METWPNTNNLNIGTEWAARPTVQGGDYANANENETKVPMEVSLSTVNNAK